MQKYGQMVFCFFVSVLLLTSPAAAEHVSNYELNERLTKLEESGGWTERIAISGLVEVETFFESLDIEGADDESSSDLSLATLELGLDATVSDRVSGTVLLLYEDGEDFLVDEGFVLIKASDSLSFKAGEFYVPFGLFETNMIQDPLTLELGETRETALEMGFEGAGFYGAVYAFNGDVDEAGDDSTIDNFGLIAGYGLGNDNFTLDFGAGYINNLVDSDGLTGILDEAREELAEGETLDLVDYVGGLNLYAILNFGPITLIGEYVGALDDVELAYFDGSAETIEEMEKLKTWNMEAGYTFAFGEKEAVVALGYQGSDNAEEALPESRVLGTIGMSVFENAFMKLEYFHDEYGSDDTADVVTAQLGVEF